MEHGPVLSILTASPVEQNRSLVGGALWPQRDLRRRALPSDWSKIHSFSLHIHTHHKIQAMVVIVQLLHTWTYELSGPEVTMRGWEERNSIPLTAPLWASLMTAPSLRRSRSHTAMWPRGLADATVLKPSEENVCKLWCQFFEESNIHSFHR